MNLRPFSGRVRAALFAAVLFLEPLVPMLNVPAYAAVPGRVIVMMKGGDTADLKQGSFGRYSMQALSTGIPDQTVEKALPKGKLNGLGALSLGAVKSGESVGNSIVMVKSDTYSTAELISMYERDGNVLFVEEDTESPYPVTEPEGRISGASSALSGTGSSDIITEPAGNYTAFQWARKNTGFMDDGVEGVDAENSGDATGGSDVVIAVMDTGVDHTNPGLKENMYEISSDLQQELNCGPYGFNAEIDDGTGTADSSDYDGHGTHCAGIIGASRSDGKGTFGIAPGVKIISVRVFGKKGEGAFISSKVRACQWLLDAKKAGIDIRAVNMSFGGTGIAPRAEITMRQRLIDCDIIPVIASGNNNFDNDTNTVSSWNRGSASLVVNSIKADGNRSAFSEWGKKSTGIFAPGNDILSTITDNGAQYLPFIAAQETKEGKNERSAFFCGFESATASNAEKSMQTANDFAFFDGATPSESAPYEAADEKAFLGERSVVVNTAGLTKAQPVKEIYSGKTDVSRFVSAARTAGKPLYYSFMSQTDTRNSVLLAAIDFRRKDGSFTDLGYTEETNESDNYAWADYWTNCVQTLPADEDIDYDNFQVRVRFSVVDGCACPDHVYIDSTGFGTGREKYNLMSGTSMATPCTVGVFALLAERFPQESGSKISARIMGSAVQDNDFYQYCVSGGRVSFDAAASENTSSFRPVLQSADVGDGTVTLHGYFFGNAAGSVTLKDEDDNPVSAAVTSWSDEAIVLSAQVKGNGMMEADISGAAGNDGRGYFDTGSSTDYTKLSPPEFTCGRKNLYYGDHVQLAAMGGSVYMVGASYADVEGFMTWKYNAAADSWSEPVYGPYTEAGRFSCSLYSLVSHNGRLYMMEQEIKYENNEAVYGAKHVLEYDPSEETWKNLGAVSCDSLSTNKSEALFSFRGKLYICLPCETDKKKWTDICELNPKDLSLTKISEFPLQDAFKDLKAVSSGGSVLFSGGSNGKLYMYNTFKTEDLKNFTELGDMPADETKEIYNPFPAATKDGWIAAAFFNSTTGTTGGTIVLAQNGEDWVDKNLTVSSAGMAELSSCGTGNAFYVAGSEKNIIGNSVFFRKTAIESPKEICTATLTLPLEAAGVNIGQIEVWMDGRSYGYTTGAIKSEADGTLKLYLPEGEASVTVTVNGTAYAGYYGTVAEGGENILVRGENPETLLDEVKEGDTLYSGRSAVYKGTYATPGNASASNASPANATASNACIRFFAPGDENKDDAVPLAVQTFEKGILKTIVSGFENIKVWKVFRAVQDYLNRYIDVSPQIAKSYTITAKAGTGGTISPSGAVTVNEGEDSFFTIGVKSGYHIYRVLVDGANMGRLSSYTFKSVTADHTIEVQFAENSDSGGGSGSGGSGGSGRVLNTVHDSKNDGTWQKDGKGWWFKYNNGGFASGAWLLVAGKWYHFNSEGYVQNGWIADGGKWYYLDPVNGDMKTGWLKDPQDGHWYYLYADGSMATGKVTIDGVEYTFNGTPEKATYVYDEERQIWVWDGGSTLPLGAMI